MTSWNSSDPPDGWEIVRLGDRFDSWGGLTPSKANPGYWGDGLPWVSSKEVKGDRVVATTYSVTRQALDETGLRVCPPGTVLVVTRSGILAHTLPVAIADVPVTINQDVKAFYSDEPFLNEWLGLYLRSSASSLLQASRREGTTVQSVQYSILKDTLIPVPPVLQRKEIIDAATRALGMQTTVKPHVLSAERALERFRQAVLAAACSGSLTADWREIHSLPEWDSERAAAVCSKVQSGSTPSVWYAETDGVPFLKVYNIVDQRLDFDYRPQFISPDLFRSSFARTAARPGDVLMNIVGPPLGKVAVVTDEYPAWSINQALTLFRPSDRVTTRWLYIYLCSGISVAEVANDTRGTVGQVNISLSQCRDFLIPVPAVQEQAEIGRRVDSLLALADAVALRVSAASTIAGRLSQAVVAKALRGELLLNEAEVAL